MGQLMACATIDGILVASDSRAEVFPAAGETEFVTVERLLPLGDRAVIASAGAAEAATLAREFADFAKGEGITDIDGLIQAAVPFFSGKVDEFFRKVCEKLPPDPVINLYLLLAGRREDPHNPHRLFILWDRVKPPRVEYTEGTHIFTLPRRLSLEYQLNSLVARGAPLAEVVAVCREAMEKLAARDQFIGPPYHFWTITAQGLMKL
ncbi:MAG: hypothetical protein K6T55_12385 [Syntrophobacterales bacterium]|nr:hypothetical protein [Syntrophobacterales bacterium]